MSADRGKKLESDFAKVCKKYAEKIAFAWFRFPDAHAGSRKTSPADFQTAYSGRVRMVEVKETATEGRIPYANIKPDQIARMRLWGLAGVPGYVLICHTKSGTYRVLPTMYFFERDESKGSWFFTEESILPFCTEKRDFRQVFNTCEEAFKFIQGI